MKKSIFILLTICSLLLAVTCVEAYDYRLGDVNQKNGVNANDALLVLKNAAAMHELNEYESIVADVNKDGEINASDALMILKVAAKVDVFRIEVDLSVGDEYVIDKMYPAGAYYWKYELNGTSGITIKEQRNELPEDAAPGDVAESEFIINASETGVYELHFKLDNSAGTVLEERVYQIIVK